MSEKLRDLLNNVYLVHTIIKIFIKLTRNIYLLSTKLYY